MPLAPTAERGGPASPLRAGDPDAHRLRAPVVLLEVRDRDSGYLRPGRDAPAGGDHLDGRADTVGRDRALVERRARADRELVEPDGLVGLLEAADERAALDCRAAPDRVDPPVGDCPARCYVKAEPD